MPARSAPGSVRQMPIGSARDRGGRCFQRPAREALASARFYGGRPIIPTTWDFSRTCSRASPNARRPDGAQMGQHDSVGAREPDAALEIIVGVFPRHLPRKICLCRAPPAYRSAWRETIKAAEDANEPGRFTAFIGFEWTSNTGGNNLHRNVIFREEWRTRAAWSSHSRIIRRFGSDNPRELWKWMSIVEEKTGGELLALAHNGNLSNGRMFPIIESFGGSRIDRAYADEPHPLGAALRSDPDQRRRRNASVPFAQRRVRQLRALGQGQSRSQRSEEARDARI